MNDFVNIERRPDRIFVIGDIHGCAIELGMMLHFLETDLEVDRNDLIVFIGDYIDRGPDSKGVVDSLLAFKKRHGDYTIFLKGNHEDMLLGYLGLDGENGISYVVNGGADCLRSYGLKREVELDNIIQLFPKAHLDFFQNLTRYVVCDEYVFVHAGLDPLRPLDQQIDENIYWIRDEFIQNIHHFEKTIVFGHTPFEDLLFHLPYKIGIDTGLVYGNVLSCVELRSERVFQVKLGSSTVGQKSFSGIVGYSG